MPVRSIGRRLVSAVREYVKSQTLPSAAKAERRRDALGLPSADPGNAATIDAAMDWLCCAQDLSKTQDGGVARDYSLIKGWASSYPETTGYIVPTFLQQATGGDPKGLRRRARRMLEWLVSIQWETGAFQGGKIDSVPVKAVTFNTGQILLGLAAGETEFGTYARPLRLAADWLVSTQDADGCWRQYPTPFAAPGEKAYETHVAWALLEAAKLVPNRGYAEAALRNIYWAMSRQQPNGWIASCCLKDDAHPLAHTLGYALRGLVEGYRFSGDKLIAAAARRTADGLLSALQPDGFLPGRLNRDWTAAVSSACLTGTVQIAHCWLQMYEDTGDSRYRDGAMRANAYVRRTVRLDGPPAVRGAVKGSFPVDGDYGRFEYLSWAAKFLVDSLSLEQKVAAAEAAFKREKLCAE